jgi:hypothetical protein
MSIKVVMQSLLLQEDHRGLRTIAEKRPARLLRFLIGRLYSADEEEKMRAVRALGTIVGDRELLSHDVVQDLLRRFFWAMNDESGGVPFGIPEAIGEILAQRHEFQDDYLPLLCSMLTDEEMCQTGPIEKGIVWALGRIGSRTEVSQEALQSVVKSHSDQNVRELAEEAFSRMALAATA